MNEDDQGTKPAVCAFSSTIHQLTTGELTISKKKLTAGTRLPLKILTYNLAAKRSELLCVWGMDAVLMTSIWSMCAHVYIC